MTLPKIEALYEAHLTVTDLDRSIGFYRDRLGLELAHVVPQRRAAFFWIGGRDRSMLGLWASASPNRMRLHISFTTGLDQVEGAIAALREAGLAARDGGGLPTGEPVVFPWMPAASVFFDDPDGHSLEYIAILPEPARPDIPGTMALSEWRRLTSPR